MNHQNIKTDVASLTLGPPNYYSEYKFTLPLMAKDGRWYADLDCQKKFYDRIYFLVRDYVSPLFDIRLSTPSSFHLCNQPNIEIKTNVTYTYGKPVNGYVFFKIGIREKNSLNERKYQLIQTTNDYCLINGSLTVNISIVSRDYCSRLKEYPGRLIIEASVTDLSTNTKDTSQIQINIMKNSPYRISDRFLTSTYKPNLANYLAVQVIDYDDQPVSNIPLIINIMDKNNRSVSPYVATSNMAISDENGLVVFTFKLIHPVGILTVKIETNDTKYENYQQAKLIFNLKPFDLNSNEDGLLIIGNKKQLFFYAGQRFYSSVVRYGFVDNVYLLVSTKNRLYHWEKIQNESFEFIITNQMAPAVRFLVFGFNHDGKIVTDHHMIVVRQHQCGVHVDPDHSGEKPILPGGQLRIQLNGSPNDIVALSAVDESVFILNRKQKRSDSTIYEKLMTTKTTLSRAGKKSTDSRSMLLQFGYRIFSPYEEYDDDEQIEIRHHRAIRSINQRKNCKEYFKHWCCKLASSQFRRTLSCEKRASIIQNRTSSGTDECAKIFLACCKCQLLNEPVRLMGFGGYFNSQDSYPGAMFNVEYPPVMMMVPETMAAIPSFDEMDIDPRFDFRDSWLFELIRLNESSYTVTRDVPHSITTWVLSSSSISAKDGFCLGTERRIVAYKPFFIKLLMPNNIVLYEQTEVLVNVFNHEPYSIRALLFFYHIDGICSDAYQSLDRIRIDMNIDANSSRLVPFSIIPIRIGEFSIEVKAITELHSDYVIKKLTVIPPGVTKENSLVLNLDPANRAKRQIFKRSVTEITEVTSRIDPEQLQQNIEILVKRKDVNIVPGTIRHRLLFMGRSGFPTTVKSPEELANLIQRPVKGCGEQTAFYLAFNLYTMQYLDQLGKLNRTIRSRGRKYMKRSMNDLIVYRKVFGAYSAFVDREESLWLTGFVVKTLCKAGKILPRNLDHKAIEDSLRWIEGKQQSNGEWLEMNSLYHQDAFGETIKNSDTLTPYILIALQECQPDSASPSIRLARESIVKKLTVPSDSNSLAIMVYSLLFNTDQLSEEISVISSSVGALLKHTDLVIDDDANHRYYNRTSSSVETTSYALLALNRVHGSGIPIFGWEAADIDRHRAMLFNWLLSRPLNKAMQDTQNTLLALEAMADYHRWSVSPDHHGHGHLSANISFDRRPKRSLEFGDSSHMDLMHMIEVDHNTSHIQINTIGNGFGRMELLTIYNVFESDQQCNYNLDVELLPDRTAHFRGNEIDASILFDEEFLNEMDIVELPESISKLAQLEDPAGVCRNKYSWWKQQENRKKRKRSTDHQCMEYFKNRPIINIPMENPLVKIMKICIGSFQNDLKNFTNTNELAILEVSIISGYRVATDDLHLLVNDSLIEWFVETGSKITIYLRTIPKEREICLCFRIYQEYIVSYIQSAIVQLYGHFKKDPHCLRLYTDTGVRLLNYTCRDDVCRCVIKKKCPNKEPIENIINIYNEYVIQSVKTFKKVLCSFRWAAVVNVTKNQINNAGTFLTGRPYSLLKQPPMDSKLPHLGPSGTLITLQLTPECQEMIPPWMDNFNVLLMHQHKQLSGDDCDTGQCPILLDGQTIFFNLDHERKIFDDLLELIQWEGGSCPNGDRLQ